MPHIAIEVTPRLAGALDFVAVFSEMHQRIADSGTALLHDFKSRVHLTERHLAGDDRAAEFVIARLMTTNPRPKSEQQAMARIVHDVLRRAIEEEQKPYWWQCCVFIEPFEKADYLKTDSRA